VLRSVPTWIIAPLALVVAFAVADVTGVRPLGGIVLFLGALWCGLVWRADRGLPTALGLVVVILVGFALSHPLGDEIGAWPSVAVVAAAVGLVAWVVVGRTERMARR
jgi:hypothetical protein